MCILLSRRGLNLLITEIDHFPSDVTSCSLINQHYWIARIFSQNVLYEVLR